MMAALDARAVQDHAVRGVLVEHLALENAAVLERQMEDVPLRRIWHWIEPHDSGLRLKVLQKISDATETPMPTMQTPDTTDRLNLRHVGHTTSSRCKDHTRVAHARVLRRRDDVHVLAHRGRGSRTIAH